MIRQILIASLLLFRIAAFGQNQPANADWQIVAQTINPTNYFGVTVANGMIGLVSSPEPMKVKDVVLNGAFDTYGRGRVSNILKVFNFANMNLSVDGITLDAKSASNYRQTLDMQKASLTTTFDYQDKASVRHTVMALRHLPYSALTMVEITARKDCEISPMSVIETPENLKEVKNFYSEVDRPHVTLRLLTSVAKSPTGRHTVAACTSFIFEEPHGQEPNVIHEEWDYNMHLAKFKKRLKAGQTYRFSIVGSVSSSVHAPDPHNEAERLTLFAALERTDRLLMRHNAEWTKLWQSDIIIDGDPDAQRAVRSGLYHLYSFAREGQAYSLSPMGLSGLGYNGHVFWDTELWMYPPLLMLKPDMARSLLEYRFERMSIARQNAFSHGYAGVMFPWESDADGQEATPVWALTGPFQQHITACVGWAFWQYYLVTKDKEWLRTRGYPMLQEVAAFWVSRVERDGPGNYHIRNVIGANEWQENIDDNAFTNGMVKTVLQYAGQAAQEVGQTPNPDWKLVADNLPILKFPDGTTRENRTYNGEIIKQADVNLLAYPLSVITDDATIRKDLTYYAPRYAPDGPAMGWSVLSTLYARLGDTDKAYEWFVKSYKPNEVPPFGVLAETAGGTNPYFATGAGGMLQAVMNGFGGLQVSNDGITQLKAKLPKKWKSLTIKGVGPQMKTIKIQ
ncbi:glycosyl hydrolase family 95 catalytic domain-containing protein [Spirosoma montaniterrae]|uniref:Glycosyl hydrolase family 65 n=1 Tax=Spirosoma montaniterrae TaxID=1178516 RepID=A0A1P9X105_9BACT|nr:glycoside hydrolase family 65 protein [Spirosoma montaniterrae]AQG81273.1 glycosyl hydrolase family 65 [Spirosoma montaniterrae]